MTRFVRGDFCAEFLAFTLSCALRGSMNPTAANVGETWGLGEQLSVLIPLLRERIGWMCWLSLVFSGFDAEDVSLNRLNCFSTTRQRRAGAIGRWISDDGCPKFLWVRRRGIFVRNCCFGNRTIRMRRVVRRFFCFQTYSAQVLCKKGDTGRRIWRIKKLALMGLHQKFEKDHR